MVDRWTGDNRGEVAAGIDLAQGHRRRRVLRINMTVVSAIVATVVVLNWAFIGGDISVAVTLLGLGVLGIAGTVANSQKGACVRRR